MSKSQEQLRQEEIERERLERVQLRGVQAALPLITNEHKENILNVEDNLTGNEILNIANEFKRVVDLDNLNPGQVTDLTNYVKDFVPNDDLRALLLQSINLVKSPFIKRRFGSSPVTSELQFQQRGEVVGISVPAQGVLNARESAFRIEEAFLRNMVDANNALTTNAFVNRANATIFQTTTSLNNIFQTIDRSILSNTQIQTFARDIGIATNVNAQIQTRQRAVTNALGRLSRMLGQAVGRPLQRQVFAKKIGRAKIPSNLPNTRLTIKQFIKNIKDSERKKKKEKSFFAKSLGKEIKKALMIVPHRENKIGSIRIFTDNINNIKEIIIQPNTKMKDILNLVHALSRDVGVIFTTDGEDFFTLKGKHQDDDKLIAKIIKFLKENRGVELRLLYKPVSQFGGHFVGGSFTNAIYNKNRLSDMLYQKHLSNHRLGKGIHNIPNDFIHPKIKLIRSIV